MGLGRQPAAGRRLDGIARLRSALDGDLGERLDELITAAEIGALCGAGSTGWPATRKFPRAPGHRTPDPVAAAVSEPAVRGPTSGDWQNLAG